MQICPRAGRLMAAVALLAALVVVPDRPAARAADGQHSWTLTFSDEFDGTEVDGTKWQTGFGWGPRQQSTYGYCDPDNNVVGGGILTQRIETRSQGGKPWSVGCLNTKGRFAQRYGYWETRIWTAGCAGSGAAFWAKPTDESWPPGLDVIQVLGDERTTSRHAVHWRENGKPHDKRILSPGPDFSAGYHVFGARWSPNETVWYVDGVERGRTSRGAGAMGDGDPFYLILNTQVQRADSGCGTGTGSAHQYVDYVRVWRPEPGDVPDPGPKDTAPPGDRPTPPQPVGPAGCSAPSFGTEDLPGLPDGISEVSGMAASRRYPGLAWMIRDSGSAASVYALRFRADGRPAVLEFPVLGARNRDWEEIVYTVGPEGRGRLWVLESGQEGHQSRPDRRIYEVLEPDPDRDGRALAVSGYRYAYPDIGPTNTEAAFAFQNDLVLVTKTSPARVYRFRKPLSEHGVNRPSFVGKLAGSDYVSVVRVSDDQRTLVSASHKQALVYESRRPESPTPLRELIADGPVGAASLGRHAAVEAGDWFPRGTCALVLVSEHRGVQRLRLTDATAGRGG